MLYLKCIQCSVTFHINMNNKNTCPICGRVVEEESVNQIRGILEHIKNTSVELSDSGWCLFLSTDNVFVKSYEKPDGTIIIPHMLLS